MAYHSISAPGSWSGLSSNSGFQNSPFCDTSYTKVFVGGLAWETKSETLHRHFQRFGDILEAVVIIDKNIGRSKGYGFVTFRDPEAANRACADPSPVIDGRRANCNFSRRHRPPGPPQSFESSSDPVQLSGPTEVVVAADLITVPLFRTFVQDKKKKFVQVYGFSVLKADVGLYKAIVERTRQHIPIQEVIKTDSMLTTAVGNVLNIVRGMAKVTARTVSQAQLEDWASGLEDA